MTTNYLNDACHDALLNVIDDNTTVLYICNALATTYLQASDTYALGSKSTPTISDPTDGDSTGRKITISAITDGTVSTTVTASHVALCSADTLYASYPLSAPVSVTSGYTFTLTEHDIENPDPA
jgi:hypothetical protein